MDPFETLGIEPRFDLDLPSLEQRHRDLSRALHPDRYAGAPGAERRMALSKAIEVNEAMRILREPIRRAEAMLRRAGITMDEVGGPKPPPELLMEMMDVREELADARTAKDGARAAAVGQAMKDRQQRTLASLTAMFRAAAGDPARLDAAIPLLGELRYLKRCLEEVSAIEEDLSP
jgi:molecular chaperone HscB